MNLPTLTTAARRHIRLFLQAIRSSARSLDSDFQDSLQAREDRRTVRALLAITPAAAAKLRSLAAFLDQVEYNGRRLAKLNVAPGEISWQLDRFEGLVARLVGASFQPAREQLRLATEFALGRAYYQVREAEAQAFFGLYRAEAEALNLEDLQQRFVRVLTASFRAASGRLLPDVRQRDRRLGRALYIEHGQPAEALIADPAMRGRYASYWSFPLTEKGLMQFGFPVPYPWLPREATLADAAAGRCAEAIERAHLRTEVRRLEVEARQVETEERRRIGRELHDEAGQSLLLMRLKLDMLARSAQPGIREGLEEVREIAEQTVVELRRIISALGPVPLERLGLKQALHQLAARFRKMHSARLQMRLGADSDRLPRQIGEVIYRVAQESLQNVAKHSHATRVNLFLRSTDKSIRLAVRDNGTGCPAELTHRKASAFGLAGMRERATLLGGTVVFRNTPGKGFSVMLDLPRNSAPGRDG